MQKGLGLSKRLRQLNLQESEASSNQKKFPETIIQKIFETNSIFSCEIRQIKKSLISVFQEFSAKNNKTLAKLVYTMFKSNNHRSFHLWGKKIW